MASTFKDPVSIEEADQRLREVKARLTDLQVQFSDRNRTRTDGTRMSDHEYWEWRHRARFAQAQMQKEIASLKQWRKDNAPKGDDQNTLALLHGCWLILRDTDGLSPNQLRLFLLVEEHLRTKGLIKS